VWNAIRYHSNHEILAFSSRTILLPTGRIIMVNVSKEGQVFRCEICGNVVVVKEAGGGELVCCGEPMILESV
jgi:desulfoferrodoxin-like iron-binding protein